MANPKGFTLVELIITMGLLVLVIFIAYSFLTTSGNFFNKNSDRADAQAQARLIVQGMRTELTTAKKVEIVNQAILYVDSGEIGYHVESNVLTKVRTSSEGGSSPAFGSLPLDYLDVQFVRQSPKLLEMIITVNDGIIFKTKIYSPNINDYEETSGGGMTTSGNAVLITP